MHEPLTSLAAGLCHRLPTLTPGLLCFRCLGLYGGAALAGLYLVLRLRRLRRPPKATRWLLWLCAAPLVVDELLVTLGVWSPPGWWRTLSGALGGAALYTLLALLLVGLRRKKTDDDEPRPLLRPLPPTAAALTTGLLLLGWTTVLDALALAGAALVFWTVGALIWARLPTEDAPGRRIWTALAAVTGAALWLLLVILRGALG
jgi:uncharacterized membrane protein